MDCILCTHLTSSWFPLFVFSEIPTASTTSRPVCELVRSRPGGHVDPPPGGGEGVLAGPDWLGRVEGVDVDGAGDGAGGAHGAQGSQSVQPAQGARVGVGLALVVVVTSRVQTVGEAGEAGEAVVTVIDEVQQVSAGAGCAAIRHLQTPRRKVAGGLELSPVLKYQHSISLAHCTVCLTSVKALSDELSAIKTRLKFLLNHTKRCSILGWLREGQVKSVWSLLTSNIRLGPCLLCTAWVHSSHLNITMSWILLEEEFPQNFVLSFVG